MGQRGGVAAEDPEDRHPEGDGAGEAGDDQGAQEVRGVGVRAEEGGGRAAHAVLQGVQAAVLHADDGLHGRGAEHRDGLRRRGEHGGAGGQGEADGGAGERGGVRGEDEVRDPGGREDGGRGRDIGDPVVGGLVCCGRC